MPDPIAILLSVLMLVWLVLYVRGWLRLRRRGASQLASVYRLIVFLAATLLVGLVLLSPVSWLNSQYLFLRSLQTVVLCLLAAPAFHLACGYDVLLWGLPDSGRRWLRRTVQPGAPAGEWLRKATPVGGVWLAFVVGLSHVARTGNRELASASPDAAHNVSGSDWRCWRFCSGGTSWELARGCTFRWPHGWWLSCSLSPRFSTWSLG